MTDDKTLGLKWIRIVCDGNSFQTFLSSPVSVKVEATTDDVHWQDITGEFFSPRQRGLRWGQRFERSRS